MSVNDVKLIALDLDGTLLNSDKALTARTRAALESAAERGVRIVPATGRFYRGMPEAVRALPFVRYAITMNGAQVLDAETGETICSAEISTEEALAFYEHLDTLPVICDCYIDGWGYMTASMQERAAGVGVAMANGHPEVRAAADMLTDDCDADGVARGIERLLDMGEEQKRVF